MSSVATDNGFTLGVNRSACGSIVGVAMEAKMGVEGVDPAGSGRIAELERELAIAYARIAELEQELAAVRNPESLPAQERRIYSGIVKNFDLELSDGYISCPEMDFLCGHDVYITRDVLAQGQAGVGDICCFPVCLPASGQPQALHPLLRLASPSGFALVGVYHEGVGVSTMERPDRGYGLIQCPEVAAIFGREVYVNPALASRLRSGSRCGFNAYLNKDYIPSAMTVEMVDATFQPVPGDLSQSRALPGCERTDSAERFNGVLKCFDVRQNFGLISCDETFVRYGMDILLYGETLGYNISLANGTPLSFAVATDAEGHPHAVHVSLGGATEQEQIVQV